MVYLALAVALFLGWMWMRSDVIRRGGWRVGAGLLAAVLVVVGGVLSIKGEWWIGLPMVLLALGSAAGGRINRRPNPGQGPAPQPAGMSAAEARSILGVEPDATPEQIRAAYPRLMQRAHPDKGGTTGLAAQLNAARDRLLKG
ncbi:MAG: DnaJ domain-containing protein [Caulobacteraceae bacterium]